ncbi:cytochrome c biogenesis CcdA family protein [Sinanaerobacter chloroacetimidivorans]|uniref:Cytochrome c biogenesis protein CcdA n=1 Tax=Sinanaerobacter chloroacetimidivorans TaxID=2818044 RepID=A0A8J7W3A9_9FIRM|nr:cytochrome c biogenesis CcdA family protein [Sinanaerobacter chloroacetimidivorans]MBR0598485.1 cytochrome c biogenesis protein CcdA [Sinanaerobacter chloroacetimidivorans]
MDYLISFLEGTVTFISPCLLPMLPIYVSYFAGQNTDGQNRSTIKNAMGFVLGFSLVFIMLGAFAGTIGGILKEHSTIVNVIAGSIVVLFGLNFMDIIKLPLINSHRQFSSKAVKTGFLSSVVFGIIFSISWTPCVSAFLGSALMLAASTGDSIHGILMLLSFSLGLGIPFLVSAVLIERLKYTFEIIKKNYRRINLISGGLLVIVGFMMATGMMGYFLSILTF